MYVGVFLSAVESGSGDLLSASVVIRKFIDRAGTTPTRVGTRPLNNVHGVQGV